jgi:ABC-type Fe3+-hydroxamate transport system substrate-binding protein
MRIISTVPSQTELVAYLGLEEDLVGITKFCVFPDSIYRTKTRIGGTKTLDLDLIRSLSPDLILANKEENVKEQIEELQKDFNVYVSDVKGLSSALEMIHEVSSLTHRQDEAEILTKEIENTFLGLKRNSKSLSCLYLIWKEPWMSVGNDTFIHDMISRCGWANVCEDSTRYPEVILEEFQPDIILLSSEPFPFKEQHKDELQLSFPNAKILLVDGTFFSWYGSRMKDAPEYFQELIDAVQL